MNLFKQKSKHDVDFILTALAACTDLLDDAVKYHTNAAEDAREEANALIAKAKISAAEAERADRVAFKIKDLIS